MFGQKIIITTSIKRRYLVCTALFSTMLTLTACNTVTPHANPYEGLLPPGAKLTEVNRPLSKEQQKASHAVVVVSSKFEYNVKQYTDYYERGKGDSYKSFVQGLNGIISVVSPLSASIVTAMGAGDVETLWSSTRKAQDPRIIIERISSEMARRFGKVTAASDFSEALDIKADFIVLVDYNWTPNAWGNEFTGYSGVHLLNARLQRLFAIDVSATAERPWIDSTNTFNAIHTSLVQQLMAGLQAKLGE